MKDLVISFAQDYLSWGAVGLGVAMGVWMLAKEKSTGKAMSWFFGCLTFAFICAFPDLFLSKFFDLLKWGIDKIKIS
ncbi:hypothetical protein [Streptococcus pluranimalium]|uniref:Uncharacterized protein n=1 Tax=Streptococcus pluranimalium TaxID=82348 RepID=A0A345VMY3_9STRE|nr:hypothetical protein [Streptococcus pluranimalium]AXJ14085.1 hypothetical protein Sp14A_22030 [Streptococcus pluranimalium]